MEQEPQAAVSRSALNSAAPAGAGERLLGERLFGEKPPGEKQKRKGLLSLKEILSALLRKEGSVFAEIHFLKELQRRWPELAGAAIAETGRPVSFKNRTLTIALESSSSLHEMHFVKEALRKKLNRLFPHIQTAKIRLRAGDKI